MNLKRKIILNIIFHEKAKSMFILLNLINTSNYSENNIASPEFSNDVLDNVKKLIDDLLLVEKDFAILESRFNKKYDRIIKLHKNKIDNTDFPAKHSKKEVQYNKSKFNKRHHGSQELEYHTTILCRIVFSNFMQFYDEHSYMINERIKKIYETSFKYIKKATKSFSGREIARLKFIINNGCIAKVQYRKFHYFREKLENKLSENFKIDINDIRSILYGCNSKEKKLQEKHIEKYYDIILYCKRNFCAKNMNIDDFLDDMYYKKDFTLEKKEIFKASMSKNASYFNNELPSLYSYHKTISQTFTLSEKRFSIYKDFVQDYGYGCWKNFPLYLEDTYKEFYARYYPYQEDNLELFLRAQIFEHVNYFNDRRNVYIDFLNQINLFLNPDI